MIRNMSIAYDYATFRRPSQVAKEADLEQPQTATSLTAPSEAPTTPMPPEIEVCRHFNYFFFQFKKNFFQLRYFVLIISIRNRLMMNSICPFRWLYSF